MLTWEDDVEVHALRKRGWSISAIARHTGHDRKTIRAYLNGVRTPGQRKKPDEDPFEPFVAYVSARLTEDPHLWARTLCDELEELGYTQSYQSLTRQIRARGLRPTCEQCATAIHRPNAVIEHPSGEETQWDWLELPNPPAAWGWGSTAYLFVGSLAHSGRWRGYLAPNMTRPHVVAGLDRITRRLGGVTKVWRFDRMATVCHPASGTLTSEFAAVAKHYGVEVAICPPRRGNRKGVVESANRVAAQRWWRTVADDVTVEQAQASLDTFCRTRSDVRMRRTRDGRYNVATIAQREPLSRPPATPFPAVVSEPRTASRQALVAWRGNQYSVPPELAMAEVTVTERLGQGHIDIATTSGIVIARHRLATAGTGAQIRDHGHVVALDQAAMAAAVTGGRPHRRKERTPPGQHARQAAERLRHNTTTTADPSTPAGPSVIDMSVYERAAQNRTHLP
ncbi:MULTISPECIES: DDE-type integrase/transposase/recombinase [unclassified Gordonia (in: high G+C Gram-positive bacteria)]|uniref:Mu transposase domain-containing protein n=1 Tax=unclassified Gordonia (in: high G+C Gram-positive bacteria) TaxID=2657482 RepID=UPI001965865D|nr:MULTISPECIES: DDE-type integrase/transposase/recombinase [unclassified Gordonia (in: high G+C Gram-positive bacteria)]MBN0974204.1 transposase [Gordonia sp. BP-119]MBN0983912.1 transposase [Gordonia sp. BP-94]